VPRISSQCPARAQTPLARGARLQVRAGHVAALWPVRVL
jgi:hypothetical protein